MKRRIDIAIWVVLLSVSVLGPAGAQELQPSKVANLFSWATSAPPAWGTGILYALLGVVGALVTVFSLVGGAVPGTAGFARIEAGLKRVEEREKLLDQLLRGPARNPEEIKVIEIATNNLRDDVTADRTRQFALAAMLYAVLGAFFASLLAQDLLQALVIGAGWTAYLGALGLKSDYAERKSLKDEVTERMETLVARSLEGATFTDHERKEATEVLSEATVSKAL